jgi:hypothetical protein
VRQAHRVRLGIAFLVIAGAITATGMTAASASTSSRASGFAALGDITVPRTSHSVDQKADVSAVTSGNWSGYADVKSTYSTVSATWKEPKVTCSSKATQLAAFWVGIDGYTSGTVEQDGTIALCQNGEASYATWWEMYPSNSVQFVGENVSPGDKITASVVKSGSSYALSVTDSTNPSNSFHKTETCSASTCVDSSAEWIAEAPSGSSGVYPLAKFSTWKVSGSAVTGASGAGTISSYKDKEITMVDSGNKVKASPGALNQAGAAFSDTWKAST